MNDYHYQKGWMPSREIRRRKRWDRASVAIMVVLLAGLAVSYGVQYRQTEAELPTGLTHHARGVENNLRP